MLLDRGSTPLYYQLKYILQSRILSSELKGNGRLPTEAELCTEYNVSRTTVGQALSELTKEGLIYRDWERRTFVTDRVELKRPELRGSTDNLIAAAEGARIKVLSYQEIFPPPEIANIFQLKKTEKVFRLELVRFIPIGPIGYSLIYLPFTLGKNISSEEFRETTEIITFVEEKLKEKAHHAKQTFDVGLADKVLSKNLHVGGKTPLLVVKRNYYTRKGSLMFVAVSYFRSDLYKYEINLVRT